TLLYQHLFWFWGHPEVYILFLPATGMISSIIPAAARRPLAGRVWIVASLMAIAFISFGVWVHHMFATGGPAQALGYFSAASYIIAIPSGVQFFCWIATIWGGKVRFHTPMLFSIGFLVIFLLGGITGVMAATMPFDWQAHDTYFIVAHFHYVLNGAVVFPIFGALYHWVPKMTGRMLSERLGRWSFWVMFVGFNVSFFPMHVLGLQGMPRRVYTYQDGLGWTTLNVIVSAGAAAFGIGTALTLVNLAWSHRRGAAAPPNPWGASTLEWATTSPPPDVNFPQIPVVRSLDPLWHGRLETVTDEDLAAGRTDPGFGIEGARQREMTTTRGLRAVPDEVLRVPEETSLPFWVALATFVLFVGLLVEANLVLVVGVVVGLLALVTWAWRTDEDLA
ncbi:MAG TPA: cbb3-type cytochrome c oxidase subunit I, partial [Aquihabitans sp.]|nr:cbb3-type cytochrome c oxidase subunit I [Aquihabitans sp.]